MDFIHRTAEGQNLSAQDKRGVVPPLKSPFGFQKASFHTNLRLILLKIVLFSHKTRALIDYLHGYQRE
jgi:hypothetical protein